MDWFRFCGAVIPCLNEAATIGPLVTAVRQHVETVLVVDDGSSDGSAQVARKNGAHVIRNPRAEGKGASLSSGMRWFAENRFEWAVTMDGDGQHLPADIPSFFRAAEQTSASMIVGNRMSSAESMPWLRRKTNQAMSKMLSRLSHQTLPDTQCGFRLIKVSAWLESNLQTRHFEIESESLMAFIARSHAVEFVPVCTVYAGEKSRISPLRDTIRWLQWYCSARHADYARLSLDRTMIPAESEH